MSTFVGPPPGAKLTPMMERYLEVKAETPGTILLFRMGDFYELFFEDAEVAAKVLGITLTSRDKTSKHPVPMAGFPYHALDGYLHKLIRAGYRVSVCEQVEDPKTAKGPVRREVTRIVTPGTLTDDELLDPLSSNYLACCQLQGEVTHLSWIELSTGQFFTSEVETHSLRDELARIAPSELLVSEDQLEELQVTHQLDERDVLMTPRADWHFAPKVCHDRLCQFFEMKSLEGFDLPYGVDHYAAAGALLEYVEETQKAALGHITALLPFRCTHTMQIDEATRRSLELTRTLRSGERQGSLLDVIDETVTSMGSRQLAEWVTNPLIELNAIEARAEAVEELFTDERLLEALRQQLSPTYDLQRLAGRVATGRCSPRDLNCLAATLAQLPKSKALLTARSSALLNTIEQQLELCPDVRSRIETMLVEEPPLSITEGGLVRSGYHQQLDEYRDLASGGKAWIAKYQAQQSEETGIPNLKVGYNKVFGYYLEVTAAHKDKVPEHFHRKQTLKNQERYITPELKEYEEKVLRAEQQAFALEQQLFQELRTFVAGYVSQLMQTASLLAQLDALSGLAFLARKQSYVRPLMTTEPLLEISAGRHPVLDRILPAGQFVPNDIRLGHEEGRVQLITGPNMAGKSTYIRQTALITILAQIGSFVPADSATVGIADRVFARVGASDELGKGQSTFMVEMTETARILNSATSNSLVILDEIGRGTSTYDGLSLAWAITEYLHDRIEARTLFATHYHELTDLENTLPAVRNWNVAVHEQNGDVVFLHRIVPGTADRSYGIHVARLAGVPREVLTRADSVLATWEGRAKTLQAPAQRMTDKPKMTQMRLFTIEPSHPVLEKLSQVDLESITPLDAFAQLMELKKLAQGD